MLVLAAVLAFVSAGLPLAAAVPLDINDPVSIRNAAKLLATNLMSYETSLAPGSVTTGLLPYPPYYWWESGGVWGGMIDYWAYTGDTTWEQDAANALYAQAGPNRDLIMPSQMFDEGNDDQGFWALSVATAFEYGLPSVDGLSYADVDAAVFEELVSRWLTVGALTCGGGLKWQFYTSNKGYDYKSSVTQGSFFQLSARLARYTLNSTYADWATKVWDWSSSIGLINPSYRVFDGTSDLTNCSQINELQWTYDNALFMYGAANMYAVTGDSVWEDRVQGLVAEAKFLFFSPTNTTTGVMYEIGCEPYGTCMVDQFSFKAYLARWMAKTTVLVPSVAGTIWPLLEASAMAAANACTGGSSGTSCGEKWYVGGFDGSVGVGQQLSALEVVQALLVRFGQQPALPHGNVAVSVPSQYPQAPRPTLETTVPAQVIPYTHSTDTILLDSVLPITSITSRFISTVFSTTSSSPRKASHFPPKTRSRHASMSSSSNVETASKDPTKSLLDQVTSITNQPTTKPVTSHVATTSSNFAAQATAALPVGIAALGAIALAGAVLL